MVNVIKMNNKNHKCIEKFTARHNIYFRMTWQLLTLWKHLYTGYRMEGN